MIRSVAVQPNMDQKLPKSKLYLSEDVILLVIFDKYEKNADLLSKEERERFINSMLTLDILPPRIFFGNSAFKMENTNTLPLTISDRRCRYLVLNVVSPEILIQQRTIKRLLQMFANDLTTPWKYNNFIFISSCLSFNDALLRPIFKNKRFDFWRPLLSAQIAALRVHGMDSLRDPVFRALMMSMSLWNRDHYYFAMRRGIADVIKNLIGDRFEWSNGITLSANTNGGLFLLGKLVIITTNKMGMFVNEMEQYIRSLGMSPDELRLMTQRKLSTVQTPLGKLCAWPPCALAQIDAKWFSDGKPNVNAAKLKRAKFQCKGCRLIRYCCRNHQKKHWKFIHSQQCRKY